MKKFLMMYRFPLLVYLVALIVIGYRIYNDTYYLLALGRAIEHLGIPTTDPLIMGGDYPVVIQQWLYALGLWKLYGILGMIGVYIVSMVAGLGILLIFYRICLLVSDKNIFLSQTITLYFAIFFYLLSYGAVTRPQVFSSLMLIGALFLLERMAKGPLVADSPVRPFHQPPCVHVAAAPIPDRCLLVGERDSREIPPGVLSAAGAPSAALAAAHAGWRPDRWAAQSLRSGRDDVFHAGRTRRGSFS